MNGLRDWLNRLDELRDRIIDVVGEDLNGLVLDDVAIERFEQSKVETLDPDNILDAQGIRLIREKTAEGADRVREVLRDQIRDDISQRQEFAEDLRGGGRDYAQKAAESLVQYLRVAAAHPDVATVVGGLDVVSLVVAGSGGAGRLAAKLAGSEGQAWLEQLGKQDVDTIRAVLEQVDELDPELAEAAVEALPRAVHALLIPLLETAGADEAADRLKADRPRGALSVQEDAAGALSEAERPADARGRLSAASKTKA
jgi:hypothetical protein